jgi:hypothetical protein
MWLAGPVNGAASLTASPLTAYLSHGQAEENDFTTEGGEDMRAAPALSQARKEILELGEHTRVRPILEHAQLTMFDQFVQRGGAVSLF